MGVTIICERSGVEHGGAGYLVDGRAASGGRLVPSTRLTLALLRRGTRFDMLHTEFAPRTGYEGALSNVLFVAVRSMSIEARVGLLFL